MKKMNTHLVWLFFCAMLFLGMRPLTVAAATIAEDSYSYGGYTYTLSITECTCSEGHPGEATIFEIKSVTTANKKVTLNIGFKFACTDSCIGKWQTGDSGYNLIFDVPNSCTATDFPQVTISESFSVTFTLTRSGGQHSYAADCARICQVCRETREDAADHTLEATWQSDEGNHWKECTVCHETEIGKHSPLLSNISYNQYQHWYQCADCGRPEVGKKSHDVEVSEDGSDGKCLDCDYGFRYIQTPIILDGFSLAGKTAPEAFTVSDTEQYCLVRDDPYNNRWTDYETGTEATVFEDGKQYEFYIWLAAEDGYAFKDSVIYNNLSECFLQINGVEWDEVYSESDQNSVSFSGIMTYHEGTGVPVHKMTLVPAKASTCVKEGNKAYYTCTCGKWFADEKAGTEITDKSSVLTAVNKNVHNYGGWVQTKAPTATQPGVKMHTCSWCGHKETAAIAATGTTQADAWKNAILRLRGSAAKTSVTLKWSAIPKADGYAVYGAKCGKKMKLLKMISGGKKTTWSHKKLKKAANYDYYVKAYKKIDGKKKYIKKSNTVHLATKSGKYTNVKQLRAAASLSLKAGSTKKLSVKTIYAESRKKLVSHMKPLRYSTTNSKVATVSSKGTIKAKTKGRCYIYVTAGSGAYTKILVKVK